jgi:hypothetical protein
MNPHVRVQIALGALKAFMQSEAKYVTLSHGQIADCRDFQFNEDSAVMKTYETIAFGRPNYFQ